MVVTFTAHVNFMNENKLHFTFRFLWKRFKYFIILSENCYTFDAGSVVFN